MGWQHELRIYTESFRPCLKVQYVDTMPTGRWGARFSNPCDEEIMWLCLLTLLSGLSTQAVKPGSFFRKVF